MVLPAPLATDARLRARLITAVDGAPTVTGTSADDPPPGAVVHDDRRVVGRGHHDFERLAAALIAWDVHRGARMLVAADGPAAPSATVVSAAAFGPVRVLVPCRVVALVEEEHRRGFVYATLPGNPVAGVERFTSELAPDGAVRLVLRSWSRPSGAARLFPPALRGGQWLGNRRYLAAAAQLLADPR